MSTPINTDDGLSSAAMVEEAATRTWAVISQATKSSLLVHFQRVNWPLNNILPRGIAFFSGELGIIVKEHCLSKVQISWQLLNYKREQFRFQQVAVIICTSDLEGRICEGMLLSSDAFVAQTLSRIHSPGNPSYGLDFNNLCAAFSAQLPKARTFIRILAESPGNTCSKLHVGVVENWIKIVGDTFPKTAAGIQHAQIDFARGSELKLHSFVTEFMEEYDASGLTPSVIPKIGFSNLGRFLHHVIFLAWSHSVCGHEKPLIEFPVDCLVGKHARPALRV
jgi:hypothetical protein